MMEQRICCIFGAGDYFGDETVPQHAFVIAADAGVKACKKLGVTPDVIIGDFNKDSSVNSLDVVTARKLLLSQLTLENTSDFERMDVNQSGAFDIADVLLLQSFVVGKIKAFPQAEK